MNAAVAADGVEYCSRTGGSSPRPCCCCCRGRGLRRLSTTTILYSREERPKPSSPTRAEERQRIRFLFSSFEQYCIASLLLYFISEVRPSRPWSPSCERDLVGCFCRSLLFCFKPVARGYARTIKSGGTSVDVRLSIIRQRKNRRILKHRRDTLFHGKIPLFAVMYREKPWIGTADLSGRESSSREAASKVRHCRVRFARRRPWLGVPLLRHRSSPSSPLLPILRPSPASPSIASLLTPLGTTSHSLATHEQRSLGQPCRF